MLNISGYRGTRAFMKAHGIPYTKAACRSFYRDFHKGYDPDIWAAHYKEQLKNPEKQNHRFTVDYSVLANIQESLPQALIRAGISPEDAQGNVGAAARYYFRQNPGKSIADFIIYNKNRNTQDPDYVSKKELKNRYPFLVEKELVQFMEWQHDTRPSGDRGALFLSLLKEKFFKKEQKRQQAILEKYKTMTWLAANPGKDYHDYTLWRYEKYYIHINDTVYKTLREALQSQGVERKKESGCQRYITRNFAQDRNDGFHKWMRLTHNGTCSGRQSEFRMVYA